MKNLVKKLMPAPLLEKARRIRARLVRAKLAKLSPQEKFTHIYEKQLWGKPKDSSRPYCSGSGSQDPAVTDIYVSEMRRFLSSFPKKPDLIDLGCGDFSIGERLRDVCGRYVACDIVEPLIDYNKNAFSHLDVDFRVLNMIDDPLPTGDIATIRQVLQHLSNSEIAQVVRKLEATYAHLVVTEHVPADDNFTPNADMPAGPEIRTYVGSGVVLTAPPFNLSVKSARTLCEAPEYGGRIVTTIYELDPPLPARATLR